MRDFSQSITLTHDRYKPLILVNSLKLSQIPLPVRRLKILRFWIKLYNTDDTNYISNHMSS
ncbi:hypothetical protein C8R11_10470 [Nitrosomonas aestuarii]|nr:hypothetical protein C8R11_10470 [Nitrosomonas aestuarii]